MEAIKDFLKPELIWAIIGIVLLLSEFALPGLIVFFFGIGAIVTAGVCVFTDIGINAQLLIFIVVSILSLLCLRKWLKGMFFGHTGAKQAGTEDMNEFIGETAVVKEKIMPKLGGKIELHGTNWQAQADDEIEAGAVVEITEKDNLVLKVKKA